MVAYEKGSKVVLGLGAPDPAFIARGEQNFIRSAAVLNDSFKGNTWLIGERLAIADFSVGGLAPSAEGMGLPVGDFPEIARRSGPASPIRANHCDTGGAFASSPLAWRTRASGPT
jgi:glutathione S-transferase